MSSSVGASSGLNPALLSQLLQRAEGGTSTETASSTTASASQSSDSTAFSADALLKAFDTDGDGKLSKSEIQTGFQKLSQDMQAVLLQQQGSAGTSDYGAPPPPPGDGIDGKTLATAFSSLDTDGDGVISESEFKAGLGNGSGQSGSSQSDTTTIDAAELLTSLLQSLRDSSSASLFNSFDSNGDGSINQSEFTAGISSASDSTASTSTTSSSSAAASATSSTGASSSTGSTLFSALDSNGDDSISSDEWTKLLKDLQAQ